MNKKDKLKNLYLNAFNNCEKFAEYIFDSVYSDRSARYIEQKGTILSALYILPRSVSFKGKLLPSVFISGVATDPEYRGRGLMKTLMKDVLNQISEKPVSCVYLSPENEDYYKSQGFCTVLSAKLTNINSIEPALQQKEVKNPEEFHFLRMENTTDCEINFIRSKDFSCRLFASILADGGRVNKVYDGDKYIGYYVDDSDGIFEYSIPLDRIQNVDSKCRDWFIFGDGKPFTMARIINPILFFSDIPFLTGFEKKIKIKDTFLNKEYCVRFLSEGGVLNCYRADTATCEMTIEELTLWAFGKEKCDKLPDMEFSNSTRFGFCDRYL